MDIMLSGTTAGQKQCLCSTTTSCYLGETVRKKACRNGILLEKGERVK